MENLYKQELINSVSTLISSLDNIKNLSPKNVSDEKLIESFEKVKDEISNGISKIKLHLEKLSEVVEWNILNISFFGETNAGKSTIIESLINGDGKSIGDGRKDFTKTFCKTPYANNINLMDMPGIEGAESKVTKNIHRAVNKSHIVFYVVGTDKEPEEGTISKVKKFLKDRAKVYSIINVRGKPTTYKYKKELKDENTIVVEKRTKNKFREILGASYSDNIVVNGYLALLKGNKIQDRFKRQQANALRIFDNKEEIERFSNIREIDSVINKSKDNAKNQIIISNTNKFLENIGSVLSKILKEKKNFDSLFKEINESIQKYSSEVEQIISKYEYEIRTKVNIDINSMGSKLKQVISKGIDGGYSESEIKADIEDVKKRATKRLNNDVKELLDAMKKEIEEKIKEFESRISLKMQFLNLKGHFNFKNIFQSLNISVSYVFGQIIDIGLSVWGVFLTFAVNPILGTIVGVLVVARKIWNWFSSDPENRKRKAKRKAIDKIDSMINNMKNKINSDLERELRDIRKNVEKPVLQLRNNMKGIKGISLSINKKISEIKSCQTSLTLLLMKKLFGNEIIFSYLDIHLSQAVIIGYTVHDESKNYLKDMLGVGKLNFYRSHNDWLIEAGERKETEIFIAKDEFNLRAVKALLLYNNNNFQQIKKIIRKNEHKYNRRKASYY